MSRNKRMMPKLQWQRVSESFALFTFMWMRVFITPSGLRAQFMSCKHQNHGLSAGTLGFLFWFCFKWGRRVRKILKWHRMTTSQIQKKTTTTHRQVGQKHKREEGQTHTHREGGGEEEWDGEGAGTKHMCASESHVLFKWLLLERVTICNSR